MLPTSNPKRRMNGETAEILVGPPASGCTDRSVEDPNLASKRDAAASKTDAANLDSSGLSSRAAQEPVFLVVEDDAAVARVVSRRLAAFGRVLVAETCKSTLAYLKKLSLTALVVDVTLPDGSGLELAAGVRDRQPSLPILVLSGEVNADRLRQAHAMDAHYLLKPIKLEQLDLFATRACNAAKNDEQRVADLCAELAREHRLTKTELDVLRLAVDGGSRTELAARRGAKLETLRKQVQDLLDKLDQPTLEAAVSAILRAALRRPSPPLP
jgi:DNA-binding NarL/FixJ family response regulator